jgi:hypothetical protein
MARCRKSPSLENAGGARIIRGSSGADFSAFLQDLLAG